MGETERERGTERKRESIHEVQRGRPKWDAGVRFMWNKFKSLPEVQPGDLHIKRDERRVCVRAHVLEGVRVVACDHNPPPPPPPHHHQRRRWNTCGRTTKESPGSLCRIRAIFGASGLLFGRSGQISSTACTPRGPCIKYFPNTPGPFVSPRSDRLFSTILKHSSCCQISFFFFCLEFFCDSTAGAPGLQFHIQHPPPPPLPHTPPLPLQHL